MKLTKELLKTIILEELKALNCGGAGSGSKLTPQELRKRQKQREDADTRSRRLKSFQGGRELMSLARGITEEDEENCSVGNPSHDKEDGKFTSADRAGSWSISKKGSNCAHGQRAKGPKGKDTSVCGRKNQYKSCATGKIKEDQLDDNNGQEQAFQELHYEHAKLKLKFDELTNKHSQAIAELKRVKALLSKAGTGMDWATCLSQVNRATLAGKGDLNKPAK